MLAAAREPASERGSKSADDRTVEERPHEDIWPRGEAHRSDRWREADLHGWVVGAPAALRNRAAAAVVCRGVVAGSIGGGGDRKSGVEGKRGDFGGGRII